VSELKERKFKSAPYFDIIRCRRHRKHAQERGKKETMQIFIKTLTGRKQALNFESEDSVLEVKQALQG
jgi:hypothetical protein